jgi:alpha-tubulin suppressor-like RCC1 family protein
VCECLSLRDSVLCQSLNDPLQGFEITFAVTEDHHVYVWGSLGLGPTGNTEKMPEDEEPDLRYQEPVRVEYLKVGLRIAPTSELHIWSRHWVPDVSLWGQGEDITSITVGASHAAAVSAGGDCFIWGVGTYGRLGFGNDRPCPSPTLLTVGLPKDAIVVSAWRSAQAPCKGPLTTTATHGYRRRCPAASRTASC